MLRLREHARGPIQRFHQNFIKVSLTGKLCYLSTSKLFYILTIWLHLEIVPGCSTFKSSIMVNTRRTGNACQSNTASSVSSKCSLYCGYYVCEHLRICGQYKVNREDVSHHCFMYLYFLSLFFHCLINSFLLRRYPNYREEWDYPFTHDMQKGGVDNVILDICTFSRREIFHVDGAFFNKTGTLAGFSQLCHYKRFVL
jgi:hypothetical protein